MAIVDITIASIAIARAAWLVPVLIAFLFEQVLVNGPFVWREAAAGRADWRAIATVAFVALALVLLGVTRRQSR